MPRKSSFSALKRARCVDPTIGQCIKALRKARKLTQVQLARASGLDPKTIAQYEQGLRLPGIISAVKLAEGLMCDVSDLCFLPLDLSGEDLRAVPVSGTGSSKGS
jgi:transcriptional regulator with XRE-family HTH domain